MNISLNKQKILVVDDTPENIDVLMGVLKSDYKMVAARDGEKALKLVQGDNPPDLILLDIMMPGMDGYEVCARLKSDEKTRQIPIIFVTAKGEVEDETRGLELGAVDYVTKPISPPIVQARVKNHLELKIARVELENQNEILEEKVKERTRQIKETQQETLVRLMNASELRDTDTGMHIKRIQNFTELMALKIGMSPDEAEELGLASTMHDLGKIGIPDNVLLKPGKLDEQEWEIMKTHPEIGAKCLSGSKTHMLEQARIIALHHHERLDGKGYPKGIRGEEISQAGRIVSIMDVFDALTSTRPYKKAWPVDKAVNFIREGLGTQFDPKLAVIFLDNCSEFIAIREKYSDDRKDSIEGALT
ncbi:HD-GYP domain-containing protein [Gemmatimonadota bacterium]